MEINKIIEKGIKGGWKPKFFLSYTSMKIEYITNKASCFSFETEEGNRVVVYTIEEILLDPKFWQAVGRVEGWEKENYCESFSSGNENGLISEWHAKMHQMIDALIKGQSIQQFIKTL